MPLLLIVCHQTKSAAPLPRLDIQGIRARALGPITLSIDGGECVCLSGPSGSGKSRLLRAIADLDVHQGEVFLDGTCRQHFPGSNWRRSVGLLPAETRWWKDRVSDHLPTVDQSVLATLGLEERLLLDPLSRLSSGERQRFGLLRLLSHRPRALLLDEPTSNLDAVNTERVERVLQTYWVTHAVPVLWVTHDLEQIRRVANRHLRMSRGGVIDGSMSSND